MDDGSPLSLSFYPEGKGGECSGKRGTAQFGRIKNDLPAKTKRNGLLLDLSPILGPFLLRNWRFYDVMNRFYQRVSHSE